MWCITDSNETQVLSPATLTQVNEYLSFSLQHSHIVKEASLLIKERNLPLFKYTCLFTSDVIIIKARQVSAAKYQSISFRWNQEGFQNLGCTSLAVQVLWFTNTAWLKLAKERRKMMHFEAGIWRSKNTFPLKSGHKWQFDNLFFSFQVLLPICLVFSSQLHHLKQAVHLITCGLANRGWVQHCDG